MQAVKQASIQVSENGDEEEEEAEFGEEDLFHQQVKHATSHLVGLQVRVPQSCLRQPQTLVAVCLALQPGHPLLSWGWERRLQPSLGWGQSLLAWEQAA